MPLPPQPKTPYVIFTTRDTAEGLKTGVRRTYDFFRGANDQLVDMVNPVSIYKGAHEFGIHEANIYIPDPDGHTEDGDAYARQMGHDVLDSFNPLNKKTAYETGKTATNIGTVIVPGAEELNALRGLRAARAAADGEVVVARAASERAAGTPGAASAEEALRAAEAKAGSAHAAYQAKLPGAGARKIADKAKAAGRRLKDHQAGGAEPSVRTPEQVAAAEQKFNSQKQGALEEARHRQWNQRQPALAGGHSAGVARPSEAPSSKSTAAIGKPSVMQMAGNVGGSHKIVQQNIADPTVQVGSGHPWTGKNEAPQWSNPKSIKAYHHTESTHGPKRTPADEIGRAAGRGKDQGHWLKPDWVEAERVTPRHPGLYVIDFGRPIGRVYHPDGSITENVTRAFVKRNTDGSLETAYPVTDTFVF